MSQNTLREESSPDTSYSNDDRVPSATTTAGPPVGGAYGPGGPNGPGGPGGPSGRPPLKKYSHGCESTVRMRVAMAMTDSVGSLGSRIRGVSQDRVQDPGGYDGDHDHCHVALSPSLLGFP